MGTANYFNMQVETILNIHDIINSTGEENRKNIFMHKQIRRCPHIITLFIHGFTVVTMVFWQKFCIFNVLYYNNDNIISYNFHKHHCSHMLVWSHALRLMLQRADERVWGVWLSFLSALWILNHTHPDGRTGCIQWFFLLNGWCIHV